MIGRWNSLLHCSISSITSLETRWWGQALLGPLQERLFDVRSFYSVLIPLVYNHFPWRSIGRVRPPWEWLFLLGRPAFGKILTLNNLRKWQVIVIDRYCKCKKRGKIVDYILIHCETASALWNSIFSFFGLVWIMSYRVINLVEKAMWKSSKWSCTGNCSNKLCIPCRIIKLSHLKFRQRHVKSSPRKGT